MAYVGHARKFEGVSISLAPSELELRFLHQAVKNVEQGGLFLPEKKKKHLNSEIQP